MLRKSVLCEQNPSSEPSFKLRLTKTDGTASGASPARWHRRHELDLPRERILLVPHRLLRDHEAIARHPSEKLIRRWEAEIRFD